MTKPTLSASALAISNTPIRQFDGLYSLNDLHQSAGGDKKHKPDNFLRLDTTKALIAEIQVSDVRLAVKVTHGGPNRGTYVCRELVYAYAMWISAKFSLEVIRAFDSLKTAPPQPPVFDIAALMREGNCAPNLPLPSAVQSAINRKAWSMAHDAYELCREHLARRVAYRAEFGHPRHLKESVALSAIEETTLDMALTPRVYNRLDSYMRLFDALAQAATANAETLRKEIDKTLNYDHHPAG